MIHASTQRSGRSTSLALRAAARGLSRLGLVTRFTLIGVGVGLLVAGGLSWYIEARLTDLLLAQLVARAADETRLAVTPHVVAADFDPPYTPADLDSLAARLDPLLGARREQGVIRVNIFAPDGTIIYSDVEEKRGEVEELDEDPHLAAALAGTVSADVSDLSGEESSDLRAHYDGALEVYVPFEMDGRVVGAYEIYQHLAPLAPVRPLVWGGVMGGFAVLLLALLAVVWGAAALIRRQRAEAESQDALYEATAVNLADGLYIMDVEDRVRFSNDSLARLVGVAPERALGRDIVDVVREVYRRTADPEQTLRLALAARAAALEGTPTAFEYRLEGPEPRDIQSRLFRIDGPHGLLGHGALLRDVTRERAVERMKSEFVSLESHELRTPLTSVNGDLDLVLDGEVGEISDDQRGFLTVARRNAARLTALINDFLDISKIEAGTVGLRQQQLDLGVLARQAAESLQLQVLDKSQTMLVELADDVPEVWGDPERIAQVLVNLLSNAHKYTPAGGRITLVVQPVPSAVQIAVRDTGIGLTAEEQGQVFTRFFRADNRETREEGGTGLGLAISRALVEQHGGSIEVESEAGRGSTFTVTLPLHSAIAGV
jgi:two-component system phosphate regulon sensor histidine kinase PhoR